MTKKNESLAQELQVMMMMMMMMMMMVMIVVMVNGYRTKAAW